MQQRPQQLALPAPHATTASDNAPTVQTVSGVHCHEPIVIAHIHDNNSTQQSAYIDIMVDSGAATHVCPPWFAPEFPIQPLSADNGPQLRTVTNNEIKLYGYKWVYMHNAEGERIVIPFYACDVHQPIVSVSRLEEQGFILTFRRLGWSQTLEIIKYLIFHFFVIFLSFAIAVCTCWVVIFLSFFCHYFVMFLSFFCRFSKNRIIF